jgi:hypothetical protein
MNSKLEVIAQYSGSNLKSLFLTQPQVSLTETHQQFGEANMHLVKKPLSVRYNVVHNKEEIFFLVLVLENPICSKPGFQSTIYYLWGWKCTCKAHIELLGSHIADIISCQIPKNKALNQKHPQMLEIFRRNLSMWPSFHIRKVIPQMNP